MILTFLCTRTGFSYPIFWFLIDLKESDEIFNDYLWPLSNSLFMHFNAADDHLINDEGMNNDTNECNGTSRSLNDVKHADLDTRIRNLVKNRTHGKCDPKGDILLLTNLTYYGYCFNPVSFYYVLKESAPKQLPKNSSTWEVCNYEYQAIEHCMLYISVARYYPVYEKTNCALLTSFYYCHL